VLSLFWWWLALLPLPLWALLSPLAWPMMLMMMLVLPPSPLAPRGLVRRLSSPWLRSPSAVSWPALASAPWLPSPVLVVMRALLPLLLVMLTPVTPMPMMMKVVRLTTTTLLALLPPASLTPWARLCWYFFV
jgi:hypothetical protein